MAFIKFRSNTTSPTKPPSTSDANAHRFITFVSDATGDQIGLSHTSLLYNSSTSTGLIAQDVQKVLQVKTSLTEEQYIELESQKAQAASII